MVNGVTYDGVGNDVGNYFTSSPHRKSGSLGFWYSKNAYGPWRQIHYSEEWYADDLNNRIYWPTFAPDETSSDGKEMTLIWSDAMKNARGIRMR